MRNRLEDHNSRVNHGIIKSPIHGIFKLPVFQDLCFRTPTIISYLARQRIMVVKQPSSNLHIILVLDSDILILL